MLYTKSNFVCALVLSLFFLMSFTPLQSVAQDYKYTTAMSSPVKKTIALTAATSPKQASEVQAPRDGVIKEIYAFPGDKVGSDGLLAQLDTTDLELQKEKLRAERNEFTAHLRRIEKLVSKDLIDAEIWDNNLQKLAQIRAELAIVDEKIKNSRIRSPMSGAVLWSELKVGQKVKGAEPVYWVGDDEELWLSTKLDAEHTSGLEKNDIVAVFVDETSSPIIGRIDFISFEGPFGKDTNLYINAPRIGELKVQDTYNILIPLTSEEDLTIIPESALTKDGYIFQVSSIQIEPDQFILYKKKVEIVERAKGIIRTNSVPNGILILLNPTENLKDRGVVTAFAVENETWGTEYAAAALQKQESRETACGNGTGTLAINTENPELMICNVPSDMFDIPEIEEPAWRPIDYFQDLPMSLPTT